MARAVLVLPVRRLPHALKPCKQNSTLASVLGAVLLMLLRLLLLLLLLLLRLLLLLLLLLRLLQLTVSRLFVRPNLQAAERGVGCGCGKAALLDRHTPPAPRTSRSLRSQDGIPMFDACSATSRMWMRH